MKCRYLPNEPGCIQSYTPRCSKRNKGPLNSCTVPLLSDFISWFKFWINGEKVLDGSGALLVSGAFSMPISTKGDKRPIHYLLRVQPSKAVMYISLCAWLAHPPLPVPASLLALNFFGLC